MNTNPIKVLIVDDEADFRNILALSLKRRGYDVFLASNGEAALDFIRLNPVDVLVSDIRMPGGDGISLLKKAKASGTDTPVVLLVTGFADLTTEDAINFGAGALFSKPIDLQSLDDTIASMLSPNGTGWRRNSKNIAVDFNVEMSCSRTQSKFTSKVTRISDTGMLVKMQAYSYPDVNEKMRFHIENSNTNQASTIEGDGVIRWVRLDPQSSSAEIGVEFTERPSGLFELAERTKKAS